MLGRCKSHDAKYSTNIKYTHITRTLLLTQNSTKFTDLVNQLIHSLKAPMNCAYAVYWILPQIRFYVCSQMNWMACKWNKMYNVQLQLVGRLVREMAVPSLRWIDNVGMCFLTRNSNIFVCVCECECVSLVDMCLYLNRIHLGVAATNSTNALGIWTHAILMKWIQWWNTLV